jgi:TatD DNase family protein
LDLLNILKEHYFNDSEMGYIRTGVVHSFDDELDLAQQFIDLGLYIGINGCSLKTKKNLDTVMAIPLDNLLLETDCPWCDIRPSHASYEYVTTKFKTKDEKKYESDCCVKGRCEPCHILQVAEVVAGLKHMTITHVASITTKNACTLFPLQSI